LRIIVENIVEKRGLVLLPLAAAEKEIEQALGRTHLGRQRHGANDGGYNKRAAQLALKGQFDTQREPPPDATDLPYAAREGALHGMIVDNKRAQSGADKGKEKGQRARQAPDR
jgi:hypothetical protein